MKAYVNFDDQTITVDGESCSFKEAGIYCNPQNQEEFLLNDCDNHLMETKNNIEIVYSEKIEQEETYKFKAYFEGKDCPVAVGTIEADSKSDAEKILFGVSGSWQDESGNVFEAGCPVNVEVEENPVQILRKKIKDEYQIFFDRGVQTRKFNPDYNQELINRNFENEDDRTEKQEKELFFFYAGYNAESLREKERWSEVH